MPPSYDELLGIRLPFLGLQSINLGGGGNCWWNSIAAEVGMPMMDLRIGAAEYMRENESKYSMFGNFEAFGGYQNYCDLVGTSGVYVEGNAELAATLLRPPTLSLSTSLS
jgi:hypothetical protein